MSRTWKLRLGLLLISLTAIGTAYHQSTAEAMIEAAGNLLVSLNPEQRAQLNFAFEAKGRETWHFFPDNNFEQTYKRPRRGLTYARMDPQQRRLANALLSTGLSRRGFVKAMTVMSLEEVLRIKEGDLTGRRDVQRYHVSVFGKPAPGETWSWRVEGHHLSLHFALRNGKLISTSPTFFGANPHEVREGPRRGLRTLGREEDLGRALMKSFDEARRGQALIAEAAYKDILTGASTRAKLEGEPQGLPAAKMSAAQYEALLELIAEYAGNLPAEVAAARMKTARETPKDKLFFAWAGAIEPGKGDYYRVQTPSFLVEYDNTQNQSNHSHTVWRDFANDFGRDLLAMHHRMYDHGLEPIRAD